MEQSLIGPEIQFLTLLTIAAAIAVAVKYVRLPYTIALVIGGLGVAMTGTEPYHLTEELILFVFLPPLLFEGAIHFEITDLKRNLKTIGSLALPGLLLTGFLAGAAVQKITGLPFTIALLVGIMVTPTDPISVLALFKKLGVPKRLSMIVEGESVFNDGTGIVLYSVLLGIITSGTLNVSASILLFLKVVIGGLLVGLVLGYIAYLFLKNLDDHVLEVLITILLAFGSFIIAEHTLHVSGVMAVVSAGVFIGNQGARFAMSPTTRMAIKNFWEVGAFVINSLIFLMIGTQILPGELYAIWPSILLVFTAVVLARAISCYPILGLLNISGEKIPQRWNHVINWGGIHGSIPIALALGLPNLLERNFIINLVFGVVFLSLTVQGLTMGPLVRLLGLGGRKEEEEQYEMAMARSAALRSAIDDLTAKKEGGRISGTIYHGIADDMEEELRIIQFQIEELEENPEVQLSWKRKTRRASLMLQKSELYEMMIRGDLAHEAADKIMSELDRALEDLEGRIEEHLPESEKEDSFSD